MIVYRHQYVAATYLRSVCPKLNPFNNKHNVIITFTT